MRIAVRTVPRAVHNNRVRAQCAADRAAVRLRGHARVPVPVPAGRAAVHVFELAAAGVARGAGAAVGGVEGVVGVSEGLRGLPLESRTPPVGRIAPARRRVVHIHDARLHP